MPRQGPQGPRHSCRLLRGRPRIASRRLELGSGRLEIAQWWLKIPFCAVGSLHQVALDGYKYVFPVGPRRTEITIIAFELQ
jgi:hypothetical protein